jgi:Zn-finger nucleic acid-binding protein
MQTKEPNTCPKCEPRLRPFDELLPKARRCLACGGLWVPQDVIQERVEARARSRSARVRRSPLTGIAQRGTPWKCPDCPTQSLIEHTVGETSIERCPRCHGVFLDAGELERIVHSAVGPSARLPGLRALGVASERPDFVEAIGETVVESIVGILVSAAVSH